MSLRKLKSSLVRSNYGRPASGFGSSGWRSFLTVAAAVAIALPVSAQEDPPAPDEVEGVALERPPWEGRIDLGYTWQSGRTEKNDFSLHGQAQRDLDPHEFRAKAEFLFGEADGEKNTHRYGGEFRWRRSLSERFFTQAISLYESDRIRDLRHRAEQNVGLGYRFLKTERFDGSVAPGFTVQYTDQPGGGDKWDYLASLHQDLVWRFSEAYRFEQDVNFLIDPGDTDDYIVRFSAGVIGSLRQNINLSVRYHLLYENQTPDDHKTDHRLITSIGYVF